jgi:hypothetical protein
VREGLVPLIQELKSRGTAPEDAWLKGDFDVEVQAALCKQVGEAWGAEQAGGAAEAQQAGACHGCAQP